MATMIEELKAGLDEVDAFLGGKTEGYRVTLPVKDKVDIIEDAEGSAVRLDGSVEGEAALRG